MHRSTPARAVIALLGVAALGATTSTAADAAAKKPAPKLAVRADGSLAWSAIPGTKRYVLAQKLVGGRPTFVVVPGRTASPRAATGTTMTFTVRAATPGARWSAPRTVRWRGTKPAAAPAATAATTTPAGTVAAPATTATTPRTATTPAPAGTGPSTGTTRPVLVTTVTAPAPTAPAAGSPAPAATTPAAPTPVTVTVPAPAATVTVPVTPPAAPTTPAPAPAPTTTTTAPAATTPAAPTPAPATTPAATTPATTTTSAPAPADPGSSAPSSPRHTVVGVTSGSVLSMNLAPLRSLGATTTRAEFDVDATVAQIGPAVEGAVRAGIQPILLAGFQGQDPTPAEVANVATWAKAFGPGGTWWAGKDVDARAVPVHIEFGNETSYGSQYPQLAGNPDWATTSFYRSLAMEYGRDVRSLAVQVAAVNPAVDVLAVGDAPGNWPQWMDGMFAGAPDLAEHVGGWTVHPYGPDWKSRIDSVVKYSGDHGSSAPIYATEYGLSTDDGRCLTQNYGWDRCMSYAQAATAVTSAIQGMEARYGSRLGGVWLYQAMDQGAAGSSDDSERYFGTLTADGRAKGAYTAAVRALLG